MKVSLVYVSRCISARAVHKDTSDRYVESERGAKETRRERERRELRYGLLYRINQFN